MRLPGHSPSSRSPASLSPAELSSPVSSPVPPPRRGSVLRNPVVLAPSPVHSSPVQHRAPPPAPAPAADPDSSEDEAASPGRGAEVSAAVEGALDEMIDEFLARMGGLDLAEDDHAQVLSSLEPLYEAALASVRAQVQVSREAQGRGEREAAYRDRRDGLPYWRVARATAAHQSRSPVHDVRRP